MLLDAGMIDQAKELTAKMRVLFLMALGLLLALAACDTALPTHTPIPPTVTLSLPETTPPPATDTPTAVPSPLPTATPVPPSATPLVVVPTDTPTPHTTRAAGTPTKAAGKVV